MTSNSASETRVAQERMAAAIQRLGAERGALAELLANLMAVVAEEAVQNAGFGARLNDALIGQVHREEAISLDETLAILKASASSGIATKARLRKGRRAPGPWDPYKVFAEVGEVGLRERLSELELEQLRDIIAENGLDPDRRAMKWVTMDKVVGRIVERVVGRAGKGDAFRDA